VLVFIVLKRRRRRRRRVKQDSPQQQFNQQLSETQSLTTMTKTKDSIPMTILSSTTDLIPFALTFLCNYLKLTIIFDIKDTEICKNKDQQIPFNQLVIEKEIGLGRRGKVFLGSWKEKQVALKFCEVEGAIDEFVTEMNVLLYLHFLD
jgi:hypothetical protein